MKRCLFVGLGGIGQRHLRNLRSLVGESVDVLAYRVRDERAVLSDTLEIIPGEDVNQRYGVRSFSDLDQALALKPNLTFVTNPTNLHVEIAQKAADCGSHLFIEKPLSHTYAGVDELIATVERRGLVTSVAYQLRYHPALAQLGSWLREGRLGKLVAVRAEVGEYMPGFHKYEDYRRMYAARRDLGGGVILTQIHEFDYLYSLLGMPERVYCVGGKLSSLDIDVEDVASTTLTYRRDDGAAFPVHVHQDYLQRPAARSCQLVGDRGKAIWSLSGGSLVLYDMDGKLQEQHDYSGMPRNQMFLGEIRDMLDSVAGKVSPRVSLRDGAASLRMALAAVKSMGSGVAEPVSA